MGITAFHIIKLNNYKHGSYISLAKYTCGYHSDYSYACAVYLPPQKQLLSVVSLGTLTRRLRWSVCNALPCSGAVSAIGEAISTFSHLLMDLRNCVTTFESAYNEWTTEPTEDVGRVKRVNTGKGALESK
jgi:hypothetical protein